MITRFMYFLIVLLLFLQLSTSGVQSFHNFRIRRLGKNCGSDILFSTTLSTNVEDKPQPIRLNKVFKATHSRREADRLIKEGRITVNDETSFGCMVVPYKDVVKLDGNTIMGWEKMNSSRLIQDSGLVKEKTFEYIKYNKPRGVICTTDRRIKNNIIDDVTRLGGYRPEHRVFPVGRLDKDSSGLILITSDGQLPNASLRHNKKQPKVYRVRVNRPLKKSDLEVLQSGIVITTVAQRDGKAKPLTAKTKPCSIKQISPATCEITLTEGRNRQIRKMMSALGYEVLDLHRLKFGMIGINDIEKPGDWKRLNKEELRWIASIL